nr:formin-like protein 20 [Aegilops tauschii subsp. strangulata]
MSSSTPSSPLPVSTSAPMTTASMTSAPMTTVGAPRCRARSPPRAPHHRRPPITAAPPLAAVFTPEQMTRTLQQLVTAVQGLHMNQYHQYITGAYGLPPAAPIATYGHPVPWLFPGTPAGGGPPLLPFQTGNSSGPPPAAAGLWHLPPPSSTVPLRHLQPLPSPAAAAPVQPLLLPLQPPEPPLPSSGAPSPTGLPIHQVRFPPSLSPLPAWAAGSSPSPVYTTALEQPTPFPHSTRRSDPPARHGAPTQTPPRFAKIDFATYDGTEDLLKWLNQCNQFFRTLTSERTWLASYHLRGAAQTWYYALEQDEGAMPPWERLRELCLLRIGPPVRGSRLAELGRLPFTSMVQDYADRFQALACHASGVTAQQLADLFVGGLPDHIRVDVEFQGP